MSSQFYLAALSKICFLCTYVDQMLIQQRLLFCFSFSYTIFLLMFFPLYSNVFTNLLKIYELPKIYNKILKKLLTIISGSILCHNFIWLLNFIENVHLRAEDSFGTKLKKSQVGHFKKNVVPKESFFFVASDIVPTLYNKPCILEINIFGRDGIIQI